MRKSRERAFLGTAPAIQRAPLDTRNISLAKSFARKRHGSKILFLCCKLQCTPCKNFPGGATPVVWYTTPSYSKRISPRPEGSPCLSECFAPITPIRNLGSRPLAAVLKAFSPWKRETSHATVCRDIYSTDSAFAALTADGSLWAVWSRV